jgi:hypothetical protein
MATPRTDTAVLSIDVQTSITHRPPAPRSASRWRCAVGPTTGVLMLFHAHRQHLDTSLHGVQDTDSRARRRHRTAERRAVVVHVTRRHARGTGRSGNTPAPHRGSTCAPRASRRSLARRALAAGASVGCDGGLASTAGGPRHAPSTPRRPVNAGPHAHHAVAAAASRPAVQGARLAGSAFNRTRGRGIGLAPRSRGSRRMSISCRLDLTQALVIFER